MITAPRTQLMSPTARLALLRAALRDITNLDPSNPGNTRALTLAEQATAFRARNAQIYRALSLATALGYPAGIRLDPAESTWPVVYIELPDAGQVSWHVPAHDQPWDGHTTTDKYDRIRQFTTGSHATR